MFLTLQGNFNWIHKITFPNSFRLCDFKGFSFFINAYQLEHFEWFFLVFTKQLEWTLRVSNKLMLFQSNDRSFIVKLLWGWHWELNSTRRALTSQIRWKDILKTWIRGCFHSNRQSSNFTLKRFIKARRLNKAAEKMLCMWVLAYSQSLRSHGFISFSLMLKFVLESQSRVKRYLAWPLMSKHHRRIVLRGARDAWLILFRWTA